MKNPVLKKAIALAMGASIAVSVPVMAASGSDVIKDGHYSALIQTSPDEDKDFAMYMSYLTVDVEDGKFKSITADAPSDSENAPYFNKALKDGKTKSGVTYESAQQALIGREATENNVKAWDAVSGATCSSEAIKTGLLQIIASAEVAENEEPTAPQGDYVYGTVDLPYADFYYGELNDVEPTAELDLSTADPAADLRADNQYDAVSSATNSDGKSHGFPQSFWEPDGETGTRILGVAGVNVAVPTELYEAAKAAIEAGKTSPNPVLDIVGAMDVLEAAPAEYKILSGNGTLTAYQGSEAQEVTPTSAVILTSSKYGSHQVNIESDALPTSDELEGVLFLMDDGSKYGMEHLENLWKRTGLIAFAVKEGYVSHGSTLDYGRYADMEGKTIKQIVYLVKDKADVVFPVDLKVKKLTSEETSLTITDKKDMNFAYGGKDGDKAELTLALTAPEGSNYQLASVTYAGKTLPARTGDNKDGYKYDTDKSKLSVYANTAENPALTGPGSYTVTFTDEDYADVTGTFVLTTTAAPAIEDNALKMVEPQRLEDYVANITEVIVDEMSYKSGKRFPSFFNEDGSVNFEAKNGNNDVFAKEAGESYTITVKANGYPDVTGTVADAAKQDEPEQDEPKQDEPKQDEPKQDEPKQDEPKQDEPATPDVLNGLVQGPDGKWAMYEDGKVDTGATGVFQNENGWWRVENGYVDFDAQGIYQNQYGWWKTTDGEVTFEETGVFQNENGWWRVEDSKVNFDAQGIYQNQYGWWKTTDGEVTFEEDGVYQNENGWWKTKDSKVDFSFTGLAKNKYGTWYVKNGKVDFSKNGKVTVNRKTYTVKNGKVVK